MQEIEATIYSCFEKTFNKDFYKTSTEINVLSTYFYLINVSNVSNVFNAFNITSKHFADVSIYAILIDINISTIYLNNIIIIDSNHEKRKTIYFGYFLQYKNNNYYYKNEKTHTFFELFD